MDYLNNLLTTKYFFYILILYLLWRILSNNLLLIVGIVVIYYMYHKETEQFDSKTTEFVPLNCPRYDLRSVLLNTRPINDRVVKRYCR